MNLDYILLNLLLLVVFCHSGNMISRGRNYWQYAMYCILSYSFVLGCRFARGTDYHGYSALFASGREHVENPLFSFINSALSFVGFNRYSCFIAYALVFVVCAMWFMKDYKQYAKYMFPCFLIGFIHFEEYMIRQAFSYSFFFIYMCYLFRIRQFRLRELWTNKKRLFLLAFWGGLVIAIHTGNIFSLVLVTVLYLFCNYPITPKITIPVYLFCVYILSNTFNFSYLDPLLSFAAENNNLAADYYSHAEHWFSEAGKQDIYEKNFYAETFQVMGSSAFMFLLYKVIKKEKKYRRMLITILNMFFIGLCIESVFVELEILNRIGITIHQIGYLAIPFILANYSYYHKYKVLYITLLWFIYYYIKYWLFCPWAMFIWDTPYSFFS